MMIINNFLFLKHELSKKKFPTFFLNNKLFFSFFRGRANVFFVLGVTHYIIT